MRTFTVPMGGLATSAILDEGVPVLCMNGTPDALSTRSLMEAAVARVSTRWEQVWLEGADHSFHVLKSSGTNDAGVLAGVADRTLAFVSGL